MKGAASLPKAEDSAMEAGKRRGTKAGWEDRGYPQGKRGVALLTVIWVLTVLMVIVLSFSFMARTETLSTLAFKEGTEKRFWAEAGLERGIWELFYRKTRSNPPLSEEEAPWKIDGTPYKGQIGQGNYLVRIMDESGKVDLNTAPEQVLRTLITSLVGEVTDADALVDCILDWRDKDDLHRLKGAESDYYESLPKPYKAKNGDFDSLEELLLVKGMTPQLLYGEKNKKGLADFLTVYSRTNRVNINTAPKEVLLAIPGVSADMVEEILAYRKNQEIKNLQEIGGTVAQNQARIFPYFSFAPVGVFTVESLGFKDTPRAGYKVKTTVALTADNRYKTYYYKTPVTIKDEEGPSETALP